MTFSTHKGAYIVGVLAIGALAVAAFRFNTEKKALQGKVEELQGTLAVTEKNIAELSENARALSDALQNEQTKNTFLQEQAATFATAVQKLSGTVQTLEKKEAMDERLLAKYSKIYFLNEHYTPEKLVLVSREYVLGDDEEYIHARVLPYLENLLKESRAAGTELKVVSAFRSFETQRDLKSQYRVTYGTGANTFSADQGYSEHQLGTTVDFTTPELAAVSVAFDKTSAYAWLQQNAHRFGFVLSYPKGNSYYIYEPWHWRFVGIELATRLKNEGTNFYDMDQRAIYDYLVKLFD